MKEFVENGIICKCKKVSLDEKHLLRKENVPAARSACQKGIVSLRRAPHDLIRQ